MKQRAQYEIPSPAFKNFLYFIHKVFFFSFTDDVEGETDRDNVNNIENPMGFVFLLRLQVF